MSTIDKIKKLCKRVTGVSILGGGISWQPDIRPDTQKEDEERWKEIEASLHALRPYYRVQNGRYIVGIRVPNGTTRPFSVRKVIATTEDSQNYLLNLWKYVQLEGIDTPEQVASSDLPAHLAALWEIPGDTQGQRSLGIESIAVEIAVSLSDGSSAFHKLVITKAQMTDNTRAFWKTGKAMNNMEGQMITQSLIDGNVDITLSKPARRQ